LSNDKCKTCVFGGQCHSAEDCDFYAPLDDDWSEIEEYIEEGRTEYRDAWAQYTSGW
jgi:hypothetical protein